jgi:hypothetical protein
VTIACSPQTRAQLKVFQILIYYTWTTNCLVTRGGFSCFGVFPIDNGEDGIVPF